MSKRFDYDLAVIGSGDAGGKAALIAAESGRRVVLIEANKWGGSSLNSSNVPFGALFHASQIYKKALDGGKFGISSNGLRYNYPTVNNWKNVAMRRAKANSKAIFEASNITCIKGKARFISKKELAVNDEIADACVCDWMVFSCLAEKDRLALDPDIYAWNKRAHQVGIVNVDLLRL